MALTLVIGNKNYSSWSFRPWIAMKVAGIDFTDRVISLNDPEFKPTLLKLSPAGKETSEAIEFICPRNALGKFVNAEITNQQLLDQSTVVVNGVRIALNLQLVE